MALIQCKDCGAGISHEAVRCPQCGWPVQRGPDPTVVKWVLLGAAGVTAFAIFVGVSTPDYVAHALEMRDQCRVMIKHGALPGALRDCDDLEARLIRDGKQQQAAIEAAKRAPREPYRPEPLPAPPANLWEGQPQEVIDIATGMDRRRKPNR